MSKVPEAKDPKAARFPFDAETVALHTANPSTPGIPSKISRSLRTLSFLSPSATLVFSLALLASLHTAGLLLFTRGFLLTRLALEDTNECSPLDVTTGAFKDSSCSLPATHSKMVFIIIDALRADFVLSVPLDNNSAASSAFIPSPFYHNLLTLSSELTTLDPTRSFLTHFIADAPTTTLQRLKGLTTGSLPTFVDAGSNFAGEKVGEDNWLRQAKRAGKKIALIGDETWLNVFPLGAGSAGEGSVWEENQVFPYDSFNVEDLDTVDKGVVEHLLPMLDRNLKRKVGEEAEWDILIAHSLGLDHAGHRFGPDHSEMTRKLVETQDLLEKVVQRLDEDTLLVVMGDHGMTDRGDHGGDSREEVDAALWIYSKGPQLIDPSWFGADLNPLAKLFEASVEASELGDRMELDWPAKGVEKSRSIAQVDLVPTLSLLLGFPIPFGNLGLVIPELFYHHTSLPSSKPPPKEIITRKSSFFYGNKKSEPAFDILTPLQTVLQAHLLTSSQLSDYLKTYTASSSGSDLLPSMPELEFILSLAQSSYRGAHAPGANQTLLELQSLEKFWKYGRRAREHARSIWAKFDLYLIGAGLLVWGGSIVVGYRLWESSGSGAGSRYLVGSAVEGMLVAGWITVGLWLLSAFTFFGPLARVWTIVPPASGAELGLLLAVNRRSKAMGANAGTKKSFNLIRFGWSNLASILPLVGHCALFASNSFTIHEDTSLLFILSTLLLLTFLRSFAAPEPRLRKRLFVFSLITLGAVRLMSYSTICREEQMPTCHNTFSHAAGSNGALAIIGLSFVAAWFIPTMLRASLRISASDVAMAPIYLGGGIRSLLVLAVGYWAIDWTIAGLELGAEGIKTAVIFKTGIARVVMVGAILTGSIIWYNSPLCLVFKRSILKDASGRDLRTQMTIVGFANTFGSTYLLFFSTLFTLLFLVSPPPAQLILTLHLVIILSLLEIFDSERDVDFLINSFTKASMESLLNNELPVAPPHTGPTFLQISILALVSHLSFFATGHQASLSTIQWSTAFIGFPTLLYPFSPILVILNTLAPFLLTTLSIPLYVFWMISPTLQNTPGVEIPLFRNLLKASTGYLTYQSLVALSSALWAAYFRRHLMVWKIFAPRFMIGGLTALACDVVLIGLGVAWGALVVVGKVRGRLGSVVGE